jgi:GAF domain-containing protein
VIQLRFALYLCAMAEHLVVAGTKEKTALYETLIPQIKALTEDESDVYANLANTAAALHQTFGFFWVGFYLVKEEELVLGPFQGPIACTRIQKGRGVCGTSWSKAATLLVPDVEAFPGHIACNAASKSEIVVPLMQDNEVWGVLDVDSDQLNDFDATDKHFLEEICRLLRK